MSRVPSASRWVAVSVALLVIGEGLCAQSSSGISGRPTGNALRVDTTTLGAVVDAFYEIKSGPAGQARDWDRFRSLFLPEARLVSTFVPEATGIIRYASFDLDTFIDGGARQMERRGFFQSEIIREVAVFDNIAHVLSSYESRLTPDGPLMAHGVNSFQLLWNGERWSILNVLWRNGGPELELPERFAPTGR